MSQTTDATVRTYRQSDGYETHYRMWGAPQGNDVIVMLHGGMSHSGWQAPLGEALLKEPGLTFVALDRRGSGLNEERGHLASGEKAIDDVEEFVRHLKESFGRVHLAGWCFGGQVAAVAAARPAVREMVSTLLLVAPGFFFNERYSDVLRLSMEAAFAVVEEFGLRPEPTHAYLQVPLQPSDFTTRQEWHDFIVKDDLRLTRVTGDTVRVWGEIAERAEADFGSIGELPVLAVFGRRDRLVDNDRVREFLVSCRPVRVEELDTGHALQFEEADALARLLRSFAAESR